MKPASGSPDICLTNPFAWPQVKRGSETLVRSLALWLDHAGKQVEILAGGPTADSYLLDGVPVTLVRARPLQRLHGDLDEQTTIIPGLVRHLRSTRPALVHSFLYADASAARLAGRPYVVSYGGIATRRSSERHPLKRRLLRFASEGARLILCPSAAAARHIHETFGYEAQVVPNGFRIDDFPLGPRERARIILCTATPDDERKRVAVLVDAFGEVQRRCGDVELLLAGRTSPGRQQALLDRAPKRARARIHFVGDVGTEELQALYRRAAVTCLPSLNEAFGLVLVESLACGTPVVAADSGAIPELIDDEVGALFPPDDAPACAERLLQVMERAEDEDLRGACRRRAERYDWSVVGPQLLEVYARAAAA